MLQSNGICEENGIISPTDLSKRICVIILCAILLLTFFLQTYKIDKMESDLDDEYIVTSALLIYEGYKPFFFAAYAMPDIWLYSIVINVGLLFPQFDELKQSILERRLKDSLAIINQNRSNFFLNLVKIHNKLRLINALWVLGTVLFIYLLAFRLTDSRICGIFSAMLFGISPLIFICGTDIHPDHSLVFFGTGCIYFCMGHILKKGDKQLIAASIFAGLAFVCKINAVLFCIPLAASVFYGSKDLPLKKRILTLFSCLGIIFLTLMVFFPFLLNDPAQFLKNVIITSSIIKNTSDNLASNGVFMILKHIINCGYVFAFLAAVGAFGIFFKRSSSLALILIAIASLLSIYIKYEGLTDRYALPLLPFACVLAGAAINYLPKNLKYRKAVITLVLMIALIQPSIKTKNLIDIRSNGDTRTLARSWVYANLPAGARIVITQYAPLLNFNRKSVEFWKSHFGARMTTDRSSVFPVEFLRDTILNEERMHYKKFCYLSENNNLSESDHHIIELWYSPNDEVMLTENNEFWVVGTICPERYWVFEKGASWLIKAIKERGKIVAEFPNTGMMGPHLYIYHVSAPKNDAQSGGPNE